MSHGAALRIEVASALDMVDFAAALGRSQPQRGSVSFPIAGGHAVLCGPAMFVNLALAAGIDAPPTKAELDDLIERCRGLGVQPAVEVSELSHPATEHVLRAQGFSPDDSTAGFVLDLSATADEPTEDFEITIVDDEALLETWLNAASAGWGHDSPDRRAASDAFGRVASETQTPGLLLARDVVDRRVVGCASLSIRDEVAILGGMSTLPTERNRGVQRALISTRLAMASAAGCDLAGTQAALDSGSMRNLLRGGFVHSHTKQTWVIE